MIFLPHLPGISMSSIVTKHGEDTSRLKPHSTRFYYRPQYPIEIGTVVLAASASNSHVVMETKSSEVLFLTGSGQVTCLALSDSLLLSLSLIFHDCAQYLYEAIAS